ncbi:ABC transporter permease [Rothia kristinae]|uniref:ABC transporter permease n=1 Tax=Rothia kristinae TaxID=37923 RepID=UPI0009E377FA|nr:ABC transporter permease [Rothia kristinae]
MSRPPAHIPGIRSRAGSRSRGATSAPARPAAGAQTLLAHRRPAPFAQTVYSGNARSVFEHGLATSYGSNWLIMVSGMLEPMLYLLSMGIGVGALVGAVQYQGQDLPYPAYIAPALLATSAMNGAIYDSTWNVFFKLRFSKVYQSMLATPLGPLDVALGEISSALFRGMLYSCAFMALMSVLGYSLAWTAVLAIPACLLIAFGFAALGMAVTSYCRTFVHMDWIMVVLLPMFLLSATFFPITVYPPALQWVIMAFPLWHAVEMVRMLSTGLLTPVFAVHVGYFAVLAGVGIVLVTRRLSALFLR